MNELGLDPAIKVGLVEAASTLTDALPPEYPDACTISKRSYLGRWAAHTALIELTGAAVPIEKSASGAPNWGSEVVGSIAHTSGCAVALVAQNTDYLGLGVDVERADRVLDPGIMRRIATPTEGARFFGPDILRLFLVKEAIYKAVFPMYGHFFGFQAAEVTQLAPLEYRVQLKFAVPPHFLVAPCLKAQIVVYKDWLIGIVAIKKSEA